MTSKDDDTLPLPGFSQDHTPDVTVDEDFIPTSQPQSFVSPKVSRNSDTSFNKSSEELCSSNAASASRIDDTLPREAIFDQSTFENNKSADFIPDTETKKMKINYVKEDVSCKKKLAVFGSEDAFGVHLNPTWDGDVSRIPESPALDTQNFSILKESPSVMDQETVQKCEEFITEIIVNDSAETVDLEATQSKKSEGDTKAEIYGNSDVDRCDDTQIFDNSSVLLLDQPGPSCLSLENTESISGIEKSYLRETVDDNKENSQDRANSSDLQCSPALVTEELTKKFDFIKQETVHVTKHNPNEVQPKQACRETSSNSPTIRKMEFKLTVTCMVTLNTATNKILEKTILDVKETLKPKPKPTNVEQPSDNMSEKSKRHSTSSSGSVYSDKTELPFALPKRISIISDQTDSSEDDFGIHSKRAKRNLERTPWSNEYLFPLAMDDIIQSAIENEEFFKRPFMSSPKKPKSMHYNTVKQLTEILESSSSSQISLGDSPTEDSQPAKQDIKDLENSIPEVGKTDDNTKDSIQNETDTNVGNENVQTEAEPEKQKEIEETRVEEEPPTSISLSDGLPVFARWTDKRYYSGVLSGDVKNDRWDVKFDDGTSKTVREDLIMPADWLKVGALVFALVDDKYVSGQIVDVKRGKEVNCTVELDIEKKEVSVKMSDLCLTDVMAGIIREKYKPMSATPRGRADIDFDNVLSGKRLREQKTPLKPPSTVGTGSSGSKKKSSKIKKNEDQTVQSIKETPPQSSGLNIRGLKSDNGHLVEDKVISADSLSGNEGEETPLRKISKEPKGKAKPRSLCYENVETRSGRSKSWLTSDGTPIPGPSGVKPKKQKTKAKEQESFLTEEIEPLAKKSKKSPGKAPQSTEKSKRKRKMDETVGGNVQKKSLKEGNTKTKTRNRKG